MCFRAPFMDGVAFHDPMHEATKKPLTTVAACHCSPYSPGRQSRPHLFHVVRKVCTKSGHVSTIPPVVKNNSHHGISTIKSDYPNILERENRWCCHFRLLRFNVEPCNPTPIGWAGVAGWRTALRKRPPEGACKPSRKESCKGGTDLVLPFSGGRVLRPPTISQQKKPLHN